MNFDFNRARCAIQHIARFMDLAQDCLVQIYPAPKEERDKIDSLYSLVRISERIAQELIEQLEAWETEAAKGG